MKSEINIFLKTITFTLIFSLFLLIISPAHAIEFNQQELIKAIQDCKNQKNTAHIMAECARELGYEEDHIIIKTAQQKWFEIHKIQVNYQNLLSELNFQITKWKKEYPNATEIYIKLREQGFSHIVTCGILGNIMAETGGNTLNINPFIYGYDGLNSYYGMCQWSLYYCPEVNGKSIDDQINYLVQTLKPNMEQFGGNYNYFCSIKSVEVAAKYFNSYYERGNGSFIRAENAKLALKYFS